MLPEKFHAQRMKPVLRLSQALHERNVREIRQTRLSRADNRLAVRMPECQMQQEHLQNIHRRLVLAELLWRSAIRSQFPPVARQEAAQKCPVIFHAVRRSRSRWANPNIVARLGVEQCREPIATLVYKGQWKSWVLPKSADEHANRRRLPS